MAENIQTNTTNQSNDPDKWVVRPSRMEKDDKIESYLNEFSRIAKANNWTDCRSADIFQAMLRADSEALQLFEDLTESDQKSFSKIKRAFEEKFKHNMVANIMKLMFIQRDRNESLSKLLQRTTTCVERVYPNFAKLNKTQLVRNHFMAALDLKLREKIIALSELPRTANDVLAKAEAFENASKCHYNRNENSFQKPSSSSNNNNNKNNNKKSNKFCEHCKKTNHNTDACYSKKKKEKKDKAEKEKVSSIESDRMVMKIMIDFKNKKHLAIIDSGSSISFFPKNLIDSSKLVNSEKNVSAVSFTNDPISIIGVSFSNRMKRPKRPGRSERSIKRHAGL